MRPELPTLLTPEKGVRGEVLIDKRLFEEYRNLLADFAPCVRATTDDDRDIHRLAAHEIERRYQAGDYDHWHPIKTANSHLPPKKEGRRG